MNEQDHIDYSNWSGFLNEEIVYFGTVVLKQMIKDLQDELKEKQ